MFCYSNWNGPGHAHFLSQVWSLITCFTPNSASERTSRDPDFTPRLTMLYWLPHCVLTPPSSPHSPAASFTRCALCYTCLEDSQMRIPGIQWRRKALQISGLPALLLCWESSNTSPLLSVGCVAGLSSALYVNYFIATLWPILVLPQVLR